MYDAFSRMENLLGTKGVKRLGSAKIAVFGIGGIGSYVVEALARCGVGSLTLVDHEDISLTDINRQLYALRSAIGRKKVQVAKEHIRDIDEDILVHTYETYYSNDTAGMFDLKAYDYIVDAMNSLASKILLIEQAKACGVPVISCLTTENKLNPARLEIADISRVSNDPFAKTIRVELRKKNVRKVKVLYSREKIRKEKNSRIMKDNNTDRASEGNGSVSFVQGTAGMLVSAEVVIDLLAEKTRNKKGYQLNRKIGDKICE